MKPMRNIEIEQGVPVPSPKTRQTRATFWAELARNMNFGDSILIETASERTAIHRAIKASGGVALSRKEDGKFRAWKLKSKNK